MTCQTDKCEKPRFAKSLCKTHYEKQRRSTLGPCSVADCDKPQTCRGFCTKHYIKDLASSKPLCTSLHCPHGQYVSTSTLCKYHYDLDVGSALRGKYGIGLEEFDKMMADQNDSCAICSAHISTIADARFKRFSVDHDHATGLVRGLLCARCNFGLGNFKDDVSLLHNAIEYLEKGKK